MVAAKTHLLPNYGTDRGAKRGDASKSLKRWTFWHREIKEQHLHSKLSGEQRQSSEWSERRWAPMTDTTSCSQETNQQAPNTQKQPYALLYLQLIQKGLLFLHFSTRLFRRLLKQCHILSQKQKNIYINTQSSYILLVSCKLLEHLKCPCFQRLSWETEISYHTYSTHILRHVDRENYL